MVFQRTPSFSIPAHNGPMSPERLAQLAANEAAYRSAARMSPGGIPMERSITPTFSVAEAERQQRYERAWEIGELFEAINVYADVLSNPAANDEFAEFFRNKIRAIVDDPQTASDLCPTDYPVGDEKAVPGHELLRHLQPAACAPGQRPKASDPTSHRDRHRHRRRVVRLRRDRLRHRFRRRDGRDNGASTSGAVTTWR